MAIFELRNIHISYDDKKVIKGANLKIEEGEFCALLGLNGSGKTTLLHGACGLRKMSGECIVAGQGSLGLNEKERAKLISFIPQVCGLSGERSVLDVVEMGFNARLGLFSFPSAENKKKAIDTLKIFGYEGFADCDFGSLSQGQRQVVILARCIVQDTPVMLMDEPDSALDFLNKHMILSNIRKIIKTQNKAGLITMHDPNFAMAYCDRLFLLKDGVIVDVLDMTHTNRREAKEKLSLIYGEIELAEYKNGFLMGNAEKQWLK